MFEWSETDLAVRDMVRQFVEKEIRPVSSQLDSGEIPPYDILRKLLSTVGVDQMLVQQFESYIAQQKKKRARLAAGETSLSKSESPVDGLPTEMISLPMIAVVELIKGSMGLVTALGVHLGLTAPAIMKQGSIEQQERWVPQLLTLEKIGAWAITEPDAGSDAIGGMRTSAKKVDGGYILNGQKTFITNGPYADTLVVYAKLVEDKPLRDRQVLAFVLDKGMEGFEQSKPLKKMGLGASPTGQLFFGDVFVEDDRLLAGESSTSEATSSGRDDAKASFTAERVGVAAMALGVIEECQELCVRYAKERELWGKPIADFQLIQLKLAKMEVARINVQNMLFTTIEKARAGKIPTLAEASAIKWYCSEAAKEVADEAIQLHGGNGYISEYRVEQIYRDARSLPIYAGSSEVQITHIARGILSTPTGR